MEERILIVRFSSIGDIVLTTPVIRCLRKAYPNAYIGYATKKPFASILQANPYLNKIHLLGDDFSSFQKEIQSDNYTYYIDLHNNLRSKRLLNSLSAKGHAFNKLNIQKWLLVNLHWNKMPQVHIVDRYLDAAKNHHLQNDGEGLDYFYPSDFKPTDSPGPSYFTMAIGGQHATKRMPAEKLINIIEKLDHPVALLGGKEDMEVAEQIIKAFDSDKVINYCGQVSLAQSAYLVEKSIGLVTHDTGMMHIGAALDVPIASIWGNTVPEFGMYPYYPTNSKNKLRAAQFEVKGLSCRPCSKIGYEKCPKGHFKCMMLQETESIASLMNLWV